MTAQYFIALLTRETKSEITYDKLFELYVRDLDKLKIEDLFVFDLSRSMGYDASIAFEFVLELGGLKADCLLELTLLNRRGLLTKDVLLDLYYIVIESNCLLEDLKVLPTILGVEVKKFGNIFDWGYYYDSISYRDRLPLISTLFKYVKDIKKLNEFTDLGYKISSDVFKVISVLLFRKSKTFEELEDRLILVLVDNFKSYYSIQRAIYYSFKVTSFGLLDSPGVVSSLADLLYGYLLYLDCRKGYQVVCNETYKLLLRVALCSYDINKSEFNRVKSLTLKQATGPYIIEELEDYYENNLLNNINRIAHLALTVRLSNGNIAVKIDSNSYLLRAIRKGLSLIK